MLRAGARVIRADLTTRPLTTVLTAVVIAIAAGALLVTLALRAALDDPFDDLFRATDAPHVIVAGSPGAAARVAALPSVARAGAPRRLVDLRAAAGRIEGRMTLAGLAPGARLDRPLVLAGRGPRRPGEVLISRPLADRASLAPGRAFTAGEGARRSRLTVVGVAVTALPEADGWVVPEQARALATGPATVAVPLRLRDPQATDAFAAAAERAGGARARVRDWQAARDDYTDESRRMLTILQSSTLLALLAAGFTLATSIGGRVIGERRRVGLLRAVGVTPLGVTALLVAHYLVLAAVVAPVGLAAGRQLAPGLLDDTAAALGVPAPGPPGAALVGLTLLGVLALVALATALPAWRAGRIAPVEALALGRSSAAARASRLAVLGRRLGLPAVVTLGAKDAFARPARAVLTVASLALAAVLVVCTMGFEATMDRLSSDSSLRAQPWDLRVQTLGVAPAGLAAALRERREVAAVARVYGVPLVSAEGRTPLFGRVMEPVSGTGLTAFPFAVREGRSALAAGEATLGRGALQDLGVRVGDRVRLSVWGRPFTVRVVGRHVEPDDDGRVAVLPAAAVPRAALRAIDGPLWVVRLRAGADPDAVRAAVLAAGDGRVSVAAPIESLRAEAADLRPIVYGVAVLLLVIAGVNLLTTLLLGVRERSRDVAVLSAIGATPRQVAATVIAGGALLALPAAAAGLPLGAWTFRTMIAVTDPSDGPDVIALPAVGWVLLALPAALALTAAVSSLAGRQAARVPVAAALRSE